VNLARPIQSGDHVSLHACRQAGLFRVTHKSYGSAFSQPWHEHDRASIDFVLAGGGVGTYHGEEIVSVGGAVEYFAAGVRHRFASGHSGIRTMHVVMPADLPRQMGVQSDTLVRELDATTALGPATAMLDELGRPDADPLVLESLAMRLLEEVSGCVWRRDRGGWLDTVREILLEEPESASSLTALASRVGRHPSHVAREFRHAFGMTVGEFGRRVRLSRASRMLASAEKPPLSRIAYRQGFADQAHFSRAFRSMSGSAPGGFRRKLAKPPGR